MAIGYFIVAGDKTSCGGEVLDGHDGVTLHEQLPARDGDRVTCGKDGKIYQILGGVSYYVSHGRAVAGTLDSISSCPCRATLIPSVFESSYGDDDSPAQQPGRATAQAPIPTPTGAMCDQRFQLLNRWHQPLVSLEYALLQNDQCVAIARLDGRGHSSAHSSTNPTNLKIATSAPSPVME